MNILLENLEKAKRYQNELTDTHFIFSYSSYESRELSAKLCDNDPLLALGKPYEATMVWTDDDDLSDTIDYEALDEAFDKGLIKISYDVPEIDGYIVKLHKWIYRVAENMGIQSLQISFLRGFRKTLASAEELNAASEGKLISTPPMFDDSYLQIRNVKEANRWLRTVRSSLNDDIESFFTSTKNGDRTQSSRPTHLYKMLSESEQGSTDRSGQIGLRTDINKRPTGFDPWIPGTENKQMDHRIHQFTFLRQCPYFYDTLPVIKPTKPHMLIGGYKKIVAEDNSDYVYTRSECHRETFSHLSQEFIVNKVYQS